MIIKAEQKYIRTSARKLRLVADLVRNLTLKEAQEQLAMMRKRAAEPLLKVIKQAIANATNNHDKKEDALKIHRNEVVEGPTYKRWNPVSRGRAHSILKRTCHVAVFLESDEKESETSNLKVLKKDEKVTKQNKKVVQQPMKNVKKEKVINSNTK